MNYGWLGMTRTSIRQQMYFNLCLLQMWHRCEYVNFRKIPMDLISGGNRQHLCWSINARVAYMDTELRERRACEREGGGGVLLNENWEKRVAAGEQYISARRGCEMCQMCYVYYRNKHRLTFSYTFCFRNGERLPSGKHIILTKGRIRNLITYHMGSVLIPMLKW